MNARDVMTATPRTISSTASIQDAIDEMFASGVRHLPVVEGKELHGLVCDRDLRSYLLPADEQLLDPDYARERATASVMDIAIREPITIEEGSSVRDVIDLMLEKNISAVPVVSSAGQLVGIISYVDILRRLRETM